MPTLNITPVGKSIELAPGTPLLQGIVEAGAKLTHDCDGKAECGTCHIFVTEGKKSLSKVQRLENTKLDETIGVGSKPRLACQALMGQENVTVELLGFGSG
jgi:ferredoxin, 2Fe-2S